MRLRPMPASLQQSNVDTEPIGAPGEEVRVGDDIEWRNVELAAPAPDRQREIGTDPGRLAQCQCQGLRNTRDQNPKIHLISTWQRSCSGRYPYFCIRSWPRAANPRDSVWPWRRISAGT